MLLPPRPRWTGFEPDVFIHQPWDSQTPIGRHPAYKAAKSGDPDAAYRLVNDLISTAQVERIERALAGREATIAAVHAEEEHGRNQIPQVFGLALGERLGLPVDCEIVQANRPMKTGRDAIHRLLHRVAFDGPVEPGMSYLIADDFLTMGGTLADLRAYIELGGGKAILASTLGAERDSGPLASTVEQIARLKAIRPSIDHLWHEAFGYDIEGLTRSEAAFLLRNPEAVDKIGDRFAARG
jgi:hypothetical protein